MEFLETQMWTKTNLLSPGVFFQAQNAPKTHFRPLPLDAFGVSILASAAPRLLAPPQYKFLPTPM